MGVKVAGRTPTGASRHTRVKLGCRLFLGKVEKGVQAEFEFLSITTAAAAHAQVEPHS